MIRRYMRWLHTCWPAGTVEKLPDADEQGRTTLPGVRIVGDLTGTPLLKFAVDGGTRAVRALAEELGVQKTAGSDAGVLDLAIVGGGVAGIAAAVEAKRHGLSFEVFEASQPFSTIIDFPKAKPIFTYPTEMEPAGELQLNAEIKEDLLEELERHRHSAGIEPTRARIERIEGKDGLLLLHHGGKVVRARRVIVAIGRSGNFRKLGVPGDEPDQVFNRLHDPVEFKGKQVVVVGGGDSAAEAAIALTTAGARVTLSYRKKELTRPKPENLDQLMALVEDPASGKGVVEPTSERVTTALTPEMVAGGKPGTLSLALGTRLKRIDTDRVLLEQDGQEKELPKDAVFAMVGREPPLDFFRRSKIPIRGEWRPKAVAAFVGFLVFCIFLYNWKAGGALNAWFQQQGWFPFNMRAVFEALGTGIAAAAADPRTLIGTLAGSTTDPGFYYSVAYTALVVVFGFRRIRRRKTPYVKVQTLALMAIQVVPLFLLPYIVLPWAGANGAFDHGALAVIADGLFGPGREYWRAFGLILAWPLFIWNVFTEQPWTWWLVISFVQTFVIIPLIVWRWGKGAYCGWICSCGALAETLGDAHRQKMPHGPLWNRLNMVGQIVLAAALLILATRIAGWIWPETALGQAMTRLYAGAVKGFSPLGIQLNYYWIVDVTLAGIIGVGAYFWFSGRVWCRFACPLAALMHIYARFSRFRIFADKKKCISCNICTSVCHQGIDIMNFANKGLPMQDPQCVRCSACVQSCPTGVLSFGRYDNNGLVVLDRLQAVPAEDR
jgi:NosR/NirI family nitrous oxide reductase transcriptional regulator